jgi:tetratricopeptide (TPR) repeat protein
MSLLLDALKKAALEKQRREQLGGAPLGGTASGGAVQHKLESVPTPSVVINNIAQLQATPAAPFQVDVATAEIVADMQVADMEITNVQLKEESVSKIIVEDDPLIFNIDEIDNEYLTGLPETHKVETQNIEVQNSEVKNTETLETKTQESYQETVLETIRNAIQEKIPVPEIQDVKVQEFETLKSELKSPENQLSTPSASEIPVAEIHLPETQRPAPQDVESRGSEISPLVEPNLVEQFNPKAGKAALVQLLARSKKATDYARKRMLIMYALLTLTAFTVLVFYYYLLQSNSTSIVMPAEMAVVNPPDETLTAEVTDPVPAETSDSAETAIVTETDNRANSKPEFLANAESTAEKSTQSAALVVPAKLQVEPQLNSQSIAKHQSKPVVKEPAQAPMVEDQNARNSDVVPPEFVTKQGVIAYQKSTENVVSEVIERGYNAYQRGDLISAKAAYREALEQDPHQRDALLGAAAVAVREGRQQDALSFYQQRLARAPKDDYAQAGLLALSAGSEQNLQLESDLTNLLREYPNASHLHFLQGSLYAARQQWDAAQLAFFEAWQRDTKNPDLAFNLAIALDHLQQPKEAARFYQQALVLGSGHPVSFSTDATERRLKELAGNTEQKESFKKKTSPSGSLEEEGVSQ